MRLPTASTACRARRVHVGPARRTPSPGRHVRASRYKILTSATTNPPWAISAPISHLRRSALTAAKSVLTAARSALVARLEFGRATCSSARASACLSVDSHPTSPPVPSNVETLASRRSHQLRMPLSIWMCVSRDSKYRQKTMFAAVRIKFPNCVVVETESVSFHERQLPSRQARGR